MKVKIGGTYVNRVGEKVGPLVEPNLSSFLARFRGDDGIDLHYYADGSIFSKDEPSKYDLVSEYPIGKPLTELDVKPGDVVRGVDCTFADEKDFVCVNIVGSGLFVGEHTMKSESYGQGIFGNEDGKWIIVSRASKPEPTAEPAKPKRMHPDDVAQAMMEYAYDCGYAWSKVEFSSVNGTHTYEN